MVQKKYSNEKSARDYQKYRRSLDGKYEARVIFGMVSSFFPNDAAAPILEIGCGDGWFTKRLGEKYSNVSGCDISEYLIEQAHLGDRKGTYVVADIEKAIPYPRNSFERVFSIMMLHDVSDISATLKNVFSVLKQGGLLVAVVSNPYYSYPVGRWKRGVIGRLLSRKPSLLLSSYGEYVRSKRAFLWNGDVPSFFRTIPEYIGTALQVGFSLEDYCDILVPHDSSSYNRQYQLYRFPMMIRLVFRK